MCGEWGGPIWNWPHKFREDAHRKLSRIFASYDVELQLYIDQELPHDKDLSFKEFKNNYYNICFTGSRKGVFRYCLVAHKAVNPDYWGEGGYDFIILYDANFVDYKDQISIFMHELGHGIFYDDTCYNDCAMCHYSNPRNTPTHYCSTCLNKINTSGLKFTTLG